MRYQLLALKFALVKLLMIPFSGLASEWQLHNRAAEGQVITLATTESFTTPEQSPVTLTVQCIQDRTTSFLELSVRVGRYLGISDGKNDPRLLARIGQEHLRWHAVASRDGHTLIFGGSEASKLENVLKFISQGRVDLRIWDHRGTPTSVTFGLNQGESKLLRVLDACGYPAAHTPALVGA